MSGRTKFKFKKILLLALKIAVGGSLAYYIAEQIFHLQFAASAGTVTLLTLQTTKWDTVKLSLRRILTFFMSYIICWLLYHIVRAAWFDYGIYLLLLVFFCEWVGWRNTISVNAVIGSHFLSTHNFSFKFMINELLLVLIGITIALVLNMFNNYNTQEKGIIKCMRSAENEMKKILLELAGYLKHQSMGDNVWDDIRALENKLNEYTDLAHEYQNNTFVSHPEYYINYFLMRKQQCGILHNLHSEMRRLRNLPKQANTVAEYITMLTEYITEMNDPTKQVNELEDILEDMKTQALPESRDEFESRALLYHILRDLEDFLMFKKRFIEEMDDKQFKIYWNKQVD